MEAVAERRQGQPAVGAGMNHGARRIRRTTAHLLTRGVVQLSHPSIGKVRRMRRGLARRKAWREATSEPEGRFSDTRPVTVAELSQ